MTEEKTAYEAEYATLAALLFGEVSTDAGEALRFLKKDDELTVGKIDMIGSERADLVSDAAVFTVANELMRLKGYDGPADAWRKLGFVWWVENKLRPAECKTMADVLAQYEEGGEPAYVKD